jgi:hypothetical protein
MAPPNSLQIDGAYVLFRIMRFERQRGLRKGRCLKLLSAFCIGLGRDICVGEKNVDESLHNAWPRADVPFAAALLAQRRKTEHKPKWTQHGPHTGP